MVGRTLNHYRILESLGRGGMGEVWLAEDTKLHRKVALKILPPDLADNPERRSRFEREAQAVAALNHPNIVTIYSVEEDGDVQFITMEAVRGGTLTGQISTAGMQVNRLLDVALPVADAVAAAHAEGIVHRDLKPDNIVVGDQGVVKVLDFGLAKLLAGSSDASDACSHLPTAGVTAEGRILGTVAYMSPEQAEGKAVDPRSDVFSLGILFYEMATGRRPFTGDTPMSTLSSIIKDMPALITDLNAGLPADLARIIDRCLAKNPADRFESAQGLRAELATLRRQTESGAWVAAGGARPPRRGIGRPIYLAVAAILLVSTTVVIWRSLVSPGRAPTGGAAQEGPPGDQVRPASNRIVVLPFKNLSAAEDAYFAAGMTEEITSRLAGIADLGVISTTSALQYQDAGKTIRQIGSELDVGYVLEGTVRWDRSSGAGQVRVTPRLIRVSDDTQIWTDRYDRRLESIFEMQSEIAGEVVRQLGVTLRTPERRSLADRPTGNVEAYQAYIKARTMAYGPFSGLREFGGALALLEQAVDLDPTFTIAWAELSKLHSRFHHEGLDRSEDRLAKARTTADHALELDPDLPEARIALGYYYYWGRKDYEQALREFELASQGRPPSADILAAVGYIQRRQGLWEESTRSLESALRLDPRDGGKASELWTNYVYLRRLDKSIGMCDLFASLGESEEFLALCRTRHLYLQGDLAGAVAMMETIPEPKLPFSRAVRWSLNYQAGHYEESLRWATDWPEELSNFGIFDQDLARALSYEAIGRGDEARRMYESSVASQRARLQEDPRNPGYRAGLALAYAGLGRKEDAVREARMAADIVPVSRDAVDGPGYLENLARVYARVGEPEKALDLLDRLLTMPHDLTVAAVENDRDWEPLRRYPRYREILDKHH